MKEFVLSERKKAVLEVVSNDPVAETAIKEIIGGNGGLTSKAVRALFDEGSLQRSGAGKKGDPFLYWKPSVAMPSVSDTNNADDEALFEVAI